MPTNSGVGKIVEGMFVEANGYFHGEDVLAEVAVLLAAQRMKNEETTRTGKPQEAVSKGYVEKRTREFQAALAAAQGEERMGLLLKGMNSARLGVLVGKFQTALFEAFQVPPTSASRPSNVPVDPAVTASAPAMDLGQMIGSLGAEVAKLRSEVAETKKIAEEAKKEANEAKIEADKATVMADEAMKRSVATDEEVAKLRKALQESNKKISKADRRFKKISSLFGVEWSEEEESEIDSKEQVQVPQRLNFSTESKENSSKAANKPIYDDSDEECIFL